MENNKDKAHVTVKKRKTNRSLYLLIFPQLWCQINYEDIQMLKVAFIEERDHDGHYSSLHLKVKMCPVSFLYVQKHLFPYSPYALPPIFSVHLQDLVLLV